jgi:hypothetical protein
MKREGTLIRKNYNLKALCRPEAGTPVRKSVAINFVGVVL